MTFVSQNMYFRRPSVHNYRTLHSESRYSSRNESKLALGFGPLPSASQCLLPFPSQEERILAWWTELWSYWRVLSLLCTSKSWYLLCRLMCTPLCLLPAPLVPISNTFCSGALAVRWAQNTFFSLFSYYLARLKVVQSTNRLSGVEVEYRPGGTQITVGTNPQHVEGKVIPIHVMKVHRWVDV